MTKTFKNFILTIILAVLSSLFLPWWSIMLSALIASLIIPLKKMAVFFIPFFAILSFWAVYTYFLGSANDFILSKKIAQLLQIGSNPYLLILLTGIIGGIAAGMSGVLGKQIVQVFGNK